MIPYFKRHYTLLLILTAFIEGISIACIELVGAQTLNSFFGTSVYVWSIVIGITFLSLAIGYYIGGNISSKVATIRFLYVSGIFVALYIALMPFMASVIFKLTINLTNQFWSYSAFFAGLILTCILLLVPSLLALGTILPVLVEFCSDKNNIAGKTAGYAFTFSTIGGITGTFLFGLVIIPIWGVAWPALVYAIILFAVIHLLFFQRRKNNGFLFFSAFIILSTVVYIGGKKLITVDESVLYHSEGLLGQIKVVEEKAEDTLKTTRKLNINNITQSWIEANSGAVSKWGYCHRFAVWASTKPKGAQALLLGFGAGSVAQELNDLGIYVDAVDIDKRLIGIAKRYFYFNDINTRFIIDDARHYIRTCSKRYDIVIFDIINAEVQPSYVYTEESFIQLKKILTKNALILINFQGYIKGNKSMAFRSLFKTLQNAGYHVKLWYEYADYLSDINLIASPENIDFSSLSKDRINKCCITNLKNVDSFLQKPFKDENVSTTEAIIYTDNKPVLDKLNAPIAMEWRSYFIRYQAPKMLNKDERFRQ